MTDEKKAKLGVKALEAKLIEFTKKNKTASFWKKFEMEGLGSIIKALVDSRVLSQEHERTLANMERDLEHGKLTVVLSALAYVAGDEKEVELAAETMVDLATKLIAFSSASHITGKPYISPEQFDAMADGYEESKH